MKISQKVGFSYLIFHLQQEVYIFKLFGDKTKNIPGNKSVHKAEMPLLSLLKSSLENNKYNKTIK